MTKIANVPAALRERPQWILWKSVDRDGNPTKVPVAADGSAAKSNDPATWATFAAAAAAYDPDRHAGLGFVFAADDPFVGVDLDGCRDPDTGVVADWAKEIILRFGTYAEVSPSLTGVKLFGVGASPFGGGRKVGVPGAAAAGGKAAAIEVYDRGRYFAVTGMRLAGPAEPRGCIEHLDWLREKYFPAPAAAPALDFGSAAAVLERARKYLARIPPAVSGQGGHNTTFHAACVLVLGFELAEGDAAALLGEWNAGCVPPWSDRDLARKVREAAKQPGERGYLRDVPPAGWNRVKVPAYRPPPPPKSEPRVTTVAEAAKRYVDQVASGLPQLAKTSLPELDAALGGGLGFGEMVIVAGRPSHGKSAIAMQMLHYWTSGPAAAPAVIISEEMGALMLGKRTVQHLSPLREDEWMYCVPELRKQVEDYAASHANCFIVEGCGSAEAAAAAVERHAAEDGVKYAVIDYAQLLTSPGKSRYEQVTNTSIVLRQLASRTKVVLVVLCQLSRGVENRGGEFAPVLSDLKDSGQLEQDADVVVFGCWPYRQDKLQPPDWYKLFVFKNRNRGIEAPVVDCQFIPERQMFRERSPDEFHRTGPGFSIPD